MEAVVNEEHRRRFRPTAANEGKFGNLASQAEVMRAPLFSRLNVAKPSVDEQSLGSVSDRADLKDGIFKAMDRGSEARQKAEDYIKANLQFVLEKLQQKHQQIPFEEEIPVEFRPLTPHNKLAEVVVEDDIRKIIFSWAIISRAPPLLAQLTLVEEILHYYYPHRESF